MAGESRQMIPELFLQCSQEASSHEVIDEVTSIVEDLSEEYGLTPAVEVSRAKAALARHADTDEAIQPADVGREVFEDNPEMAQRFEERTRERDLPEEVPVRRGAANRLTRTHRIRTDTGVEMSPFLPSWPSARATSSSRTRRTAASIVIQQRGAHREPLGKCWSPAVPSAAGRLPHVFFVRHAVNG